MKTKLILLTLIFVTFLCQTILAQVKGVGNQTVSKLPSKEKRWALIIGVDNYGLKGAVNDAKALKNALVKYAGFSNDNVILLTSDDPKNMPDRKNIIVELGKMSRRVRADGLFLFAFSGHGKTIDENAYLIPSDGFFPDDDELLSEFSINVDKVKKTVEKMKVKQVLMLIDSCRDRIVNKGSESEPLTTPMRRGFSYYEANKSVEAFVTLYATRLNEFAYEFYDKETNQWRGYFSKAVEEGLSGKEANEKGEVTLAGLIKYVQKTVPIKSYIDRGVKQTPLKDSNNGYNEDDLVLAVNSNRKVAVQSQPTSDIFPNEMVEPTTAEEQQIAEIFQKGENAFNLGNYNSAISYFDEVITIQPRNSRALSRRGWTYLKKAIIKMP